MAVRQYIGARYVLKIYENSQDPQSAEWEANTYYEPLVMVNYNNSSYISRKDVPANIGDPVSNPSYWALSGLYNGQIASLQSQINTINNTTIPAIDERLDREEEKYFLFFTDSYNQSSVTGIVYTDRILNRVDGSGETITGGGAGFVGRGQPTWNDLLTNSTITNPDKVTDVYILGGQNDNDATFSNIRTAMGTFLTNLHTRCPNIKRIYIGYLGWTSSLSQTDKVAFVNGRRNWYAAAEDNKMGVIPNICYVMTDPRYFNGAVNNRHPNQAGAEMIADKVAEFIQSGNCNVTWQFVTQYTLDGNNFEPLSGGSTTANIKFVHKNGIVHVFMRGRTCKNISTWNANTKFATISEYYNPLYMNNEYDIPVFSENATQFIKLSWDNNFNLIVNPLGTRSSVTAGTSMSMFNHPSDFIIDYDDH